MLASDLNGDGWDDLIIALYGQNVVEVWPSAASGPDLCGETSCGKVQILLDDGTKTCEGPLDLRAGDFDGDGASEVAVLCRLNSELFFINLSGVKSSISLLGLDPGLSLPAAFDAADLDSDGLDDLAIVTSLARLAVVRGQAIASGGSTVPSGSLLGVWSTTIFSNIDTVIVDYDGDGVEDILVSGSGLRPFERFKGNVAGGLPAFALASTSLSNITRVDANGSAIESTNPIKILIGATPGGVGSLVFLASPTPFQGDAQSAYVGKMPLSDPNPTPVAVDLDHGRDLPPEYVNSSEAERLQHDNTYSNLRGLAFYAVLTQPTRAYAVPRKGSLNVGNVTGIVGDAGDFSVFVHEAGHLLGLGHGGRQYGYYRYTDSLSTEQRASCEQISCAAKVLAGNSEIQCLEMVGNRPKLFPSGTEQTVSCRVHVNCAPNYPSVMNYAYQRAVRPPRFATISNAEVEFSNGRIPAILNERPGDEPSDGQFCEAFGIGVQTAQEMEPLAMYGNGIGFNFDCAINPINKNVTVCNLNTTTNTIAVDWNNDGAFDLTPCADLTEPSLLDPTQSWRQSVNAIHVRVEGSCREKMKSSTGFADLAGSDPIDLHDYDDWHGPFGIVDHLGGRLWQGACSQAANHPLCGSGGYLSQRSAALFDDLPTGRIP